MNPAVTSNPLVLDLPDLCHSLMERSPVPMAELEGAGHVLRYVNPAFCRLVGKSRAALLGTPFADTVQEGDDCLALLDRVYHTGEAETHTEAESAHPGPHPAYWSYAMWPVLDAAQHPVGVMVQVTETTQFHQQTVAMNEALVHSSVRQHELTEAAEQFNERLQAEITERKRAETALRESESRLQLALNAASMGTFIWHVQDDRGEPDAQMLALFGQWPESTLTLKTALATMLHPDDRDRYAEAVACAMDPAGSGMLREEIRVLMPDGSQRWLAIAAQVHFAGEPHRAARMAGTAMDITARKQVEAEREHLLAELQRINDELQQFARIVSHDLNEPLRTMRNFIALIASRYQGHLDAEADEYMAFVTEGAQRMQAMLKALLDYTRAGGQELTFAPADCETLVRYVCSDLQVAIEESSATVTHDALPTVAGDAARLRQVFQNLIGNALKFRGDEPPRVHVSAVKEGRHWRFSVRDNGIGIDPQQAKRLFQVFRRLHNRREYPGTGIGLAICKRIVERHGGRIWVESAVGEGATFFFTIAGEQGKQMLNAEFSRNEE